jgi:hypothetical protein
LLEPIGQKSNAVIIKQKLQNNDCIKNKFDFRKYKIEK